MGANRSGLHVYRFFTKYAFGGSKQADRLAKHFLVTSYSDCKSLIVNESELQSKATKIWAKKW